MPSLWLHGSLTDSKISKYDGNDNHGSNYPDDPVHETYPYILPMPEGNAGMRNVGFPLGARITEFSGSARFLNGFTS